MYQPSMDMGSYVVIVNAEKVKVTGNKEQQKMYYRHTGRPGSLKEENFRKLQAVGLLPLQHDPDFSHPYMMRAQVAKSLCSFVCCPLTASKSDALRSCKGACLLHCNGAEGP